MYLYCLLVSMPVAITSKPTNKNLFHGNRNNVLILNNANLKCISEYTTKVKNIEYLYLRDNKFVEFDPYFPLPKLKLIDLSLNRIKKVDFLDELPNLNHIYLTGNRIETLDGLCEHEYLETIAISDNAISFVRGAAGAAEFAGAVAEF